MATRPTVSVNAKKISQLAKENGWSNSSFAKKVGKYRTWITEVSRGKNLPSPEEAAKMCDLLNVEPEEILAEEADIELVRPFLTKKEKPALLMENWPDDPLMKQLVSMFATATEEEKLLAISRMQKIFDSRE